ncbi:hypothetical protein [Halomonas sp. PA16-9]|uniref:hypothetical protein n=1 Tax=Halomonas sp. PA16-9 TaxID=2576841 RepID=UPI0030EE9D66
MKIGFSSFTLINQRQDKPQFLTPTRVAPQKSDPAEDDPFTKRLKKQQEALESLASLPTPKEASQQQATDKVGFLRQRIEMLKAMMAFASPEQLKNMAKELKSIARELAGAAKLLNNQGGGGSGMTAIPSVVATPAVPTTAAQPAVAQTSGAESAGPRRVAMRALRQRFPVTRSKPKPVRKQPKMMLKRLLSKRPRRQRASLKAMNPPSSAYYQAYLTSFRMKTTARNPMAPALVNTHSAAY